MKDGMQFLPPEQFLPKLEAIYAKMRSRLTALLPHSEVEHVGSSAIKGAISKGDLDILVRVDKNALEESMLKIQSLGFQVKQGTLRTDSLCMLETKEYAADVAIQVISRGSEFESFVTFRDRLNASPKLVADYNALKLAATGLSPEEYRARKSKFIVAVLA